MHTELHLLKSMLGQPFPEPETGAKMKHTPTPLEKGEHYVVRAGDILWLEKLPWQEREANAKFLILAANLHDELIAALQAFDFSFDAIREKDGDIAALKRFCAAKRVASAALAKVEASVVEPRA